MKKMRYYLFGITRDGKALLCFFAAVVCALGVFGIGRAGIVSLVTENTQIRLTAWIVFVGAGALLLATLLIKMWEKRFNAADYLAQTLFYTAIAACADLAVFHGGEMFVPLLIAVCVAMALSLAVGAVRVARVDPEAEPLEIVTGKPNLVTYAAQLFRGGSLALSIACAVGVAAFVSVYLRRGFFEDIKADRVVQIAALVILCLIGVALVGAYVQRLITRRICLTDGIFFTLTLTVLISLYPVLSVITATRMIVAGAAVGACLLAEITLVASARLSQYVNPESRGVRAYCRTFARRVPAAVVTALALVAFFLIVRADELRLWTRLLDTPERRAGAVGLVAALYLLCFAIGASARRFGVFDSVVLWIDETAALSLVRCLCFESSPASWASFAALAALGILATLFRMGNAYVPGVRAAAEPVVVELGEEPRLPPLAEAAPRDPAVSAIAAEPLPAAIDAEPAHDDPAPQTDAPAADGPRSPDVEPTEQPDDFVVVADEDEAGEETTPTAPAAPGAQDDRQSADSADDSGTAERPAPKTVRTDAYIPNAAADENAPDDAVNETEPEDEPAPEDAEDETESEEEQITDDAEDETESEEEPSPEDAADETEPEEGQAPDALAPTPAQAARRYPAGRYPAKKSYLVTLRTLPEEIQTYYSEIKNELLRYRLRARVSEHKEDFNRTGLSRSRLDPARAVRTQARLTARGKTLRLYLNLDPGALDPARYHHQDVSAKRRFADLPTMLRVTSRRQCLRALELIAYLAGREDFSAKKNYRPVDYTVELAKEGLTEFERNGYGYLIRPSVAAEEIGEMTAIADKAIETDACLTHAERLIRATLTTDDLTRYAKLGVVNLEILREAGAVQPNCNYVAVEAGKRLAVKLTVRAQSYTPAAALMIALTGGDAILETERDAR